VTEEILLQADKVSVSFGDLCALHEVAFSVNRSEALAIVGPNGSGKSVLLRSLLGLVPYTGKIDWQPKVRIGYVPQKLAIDSEFPVSVGDFMSFKTHTHTKIVTALESVGITGDHHHLKKHILNKPLGTLSGGQLQRVLIAWAIVDEPDILLFDEPTSGIDVGGEETIYNLLHKLQTKHHLAIILVSHDLNIVYKYANRVLCLNRDMICYGVPHEVLDPASLRQLYGGEAHFYQHRHEE